MSKIKTHSGWSRLVEDAQDLVPRLHRDPIAVSMVYQNTRDKIRATYVKHELSRPVAVSSSCFASLLPFQSLSNQSNRSFEKFQSSKHEKITHTLFLFGLIISKSKRANTEWNNLAEKRPNIFCSVIDRSITMINVHRYRGRAYEQSPILFGQRMNNGKQWKITIQSDSLSLHQTIDSKATFLNIPIEFWTPLKIGSRYCINFECN